MSLEQDCWGFTGVIWAWALLNYCFFKRILPGEDEDIRRRKNFELSVLVEGLRGGITFFFWLQLLPVRNGKNLISFLVQVFTAGGDMEISGTEGRSCYIDRYFSYWSSISCFLPNKFSFSTNRGTFHLLWAERLFDLTGKTVFGHLLCCQAAQFLLLAPGTLDRQKWTSEVKGLERWLGLLIFRGLGSPEVPMKIVSSVSVESVERLRTNPWLQFYALMHKPSFSFKAL